MAQGDPGNRPQGQVAARRKTQVIRELLRTARPLVSPGVFEIEIPAAFKGYQFLRLRHELKKSIIANVH